MISGTSQFVDNKREESGDDASVSLVDFLSEVSLATDQDESEDSQEEKITLMTVHAAKGLEFSNVIIVGAEDDLFPSAMSKSSLSEIEEERRLLYVAITRAKQNCVITYAAQRYRNGQTVITNPSPFLRDIDARYLNLANGTLLNSNNGGTYDVGLNKYKQSFHSSTTSYQSEQRRSTPKPNAGPTPFRSSASPAPAVSGEFSIHPSSALKTGMVIEHPRFGQGTIEAIDTEAIDHKVKVRFANVDTKVLLLKFAKFKIIE